MIKILSKENKISTVFILTLLLSLAVGWILYALFGHQFIKAVYEGKSIAFLNRIITSQAAYPPEYYFQRADDLFFYSSYLILVFSIISLVSFSRYPKKAELIFYIIIIGYVIYQISFIIKASFIINGVRYFTLCDDAMVSMRYAKNLAHGYGLVWNPGGERVEGYTNPLWVIYMAFWHLFPISGAKVSLPIQISGLAFLVASLLLIERIAHDVSGKNKYVSIGAVLLTASYQPINFWAIRGMENSILGFIIILAVYRALGCLRQRSFDPLLFVILGVGILIRIDAVVLFIGIALFLILALPENRKKNIFFALSIFALIITATTLLRYFYYKDILPNTYYAKMTGFPVFFRLKRGLWEALSFVRNISLFLFALPFIYCISQFKNKETWFLLYLFLIRFLYSIYAGGDNWEIWGHMANRYICITMPFFFILVSLAISAILKGLISYSNIEGSLKNFCFMFFILLVIFQVHSGLGASGVGGQLLERLIIPEEFNIEHDQNMVKLGLKLREISGPNAKIVFTWAGAGPYFSDRYCIDLLGKCDAFIAHQKARIKNYRDFHPGHNKYDYNYSIGELKPDIIVQLWFNPEEASPYLNKYFIPTKINGGTIYLRQNSPNIDWAKVKNISQNQN